MSELYAAYEGLDDLASFADAAQLDRYRSGLLRRSRPQADFLADSIPPRARVLEVACGNGRLLVELAKRGLIESALGVDLAHSRIAFAKKWAANLGCESLEFVAADALEYELRPGSFDVALCITGAFAYFELEAASRLAHKLHRALGAQGLLCLELYPHPLYRRLLEVTGGEARVWTELPEDDPWRFYLSRLSLEAGEILTHEKTFIHRSSGAVDGGRTERLRLYTEQSATEILVSQGFRHADVFADWSSTCYDGGEVLVLLARK